MKQIITAFFANLGVTNFVSFGNSKAKTVDNVLLTFTKTLDALKEVEAQERGASEKYAKDRDAAERAYEDALHIASIGKNAADREANRAAVAVERFSKLIEGI